MPDVTPGPAACRTRSSSPAPCGTALGIQGVDVGTAAEPAAAVAKGLAGGGPTLVGAVVDPEPSRELFELLRG